MDWFGGLTLKVNELGYCIIVWSEILWIELVYICRRILAWSTACWDSRTLQETCQGPSSKILGSAFAYSTRRPACCTSMT
jgi:hypothetical protein